MWETYKEELIAREKETENFLEKFYSKHDPDVRKLKSLGTHLGQDREAEDKTKWSQFEAMKDSEVLESTILPNWLYDYLKFRYIVPSISQRYREYLDSISLTVLVTE